MIVSYNQSAHNFMFKLSAMSLSLMLLASVLYVIVLPSLFFQIKSYCGFSP